MGGYSAFLQGYKPSFLASHMYEKNKIVKLHAMGYPNVFIDHEYGGSTIFFASSQLKNSYIAEMNGVEMNSREEILIIGKYLGYPPIASEFFADVRYKEELEAKRAFFNYYGINFVGNVEDSEEIADWLWSNVPAPLAPVEVNYKKELKQIHPVHMVVAR
jgi:hypothetical protein